MDEVPISGDADLIRVGLLQSKIDHNVRVSDLPVLWNSSSFFVCEDENWIRARRVCFLISLRLVTKFSTKTIHTDFSGDWISREFFVARNELSSDGMCDRGANMFDVDGVEECQV